jgi:predicted enzyme related to lactoylglutathione lyase
MTMTTTATGKFVWFDYITPDVAKAQGFFGELFNWKTQEVPVPGAGTYTMIALGDQTIGGYMTTPQGAPPIGHWLPYLGVTDAQRAADQIKSLGGQVHKEPTKMGDVGSIAIVGDPQGGVFALWQPAKPEGTGDYKDAPGAFCWNELAAQDPVKAVAFYSQLGFTEEKMDMGGMTYHVLNSDGKARAGVMKTPMPDAPQAWMPYVQVKDVDATVAKAQKLGAAVLAKPEDVPGVGRIAIFRDPLGGYTGLLKPAPESK